ncbi:hypothetical protein FLK61_34530 [Paenalkalicoccus suaedae]|uniref:YtxH domain-containing protein n=1 Tax=Paenalkalicoccus suaedae TaxID=2592382 RepID=A0A859FFK6_9BACI|nr:hypothetical protein [Paenalkalicoccus suaedae]QKS71791.1 hypothetical protein FLK61_34530 [Paenalkalicoccus suaedae]
MLNKFTTSALAATAVAAASYFLGKEENRTKIKQEFNRVKAQLVHQTKEDTDKAYEEKVGFSDPYDIQDNSMVDEGAVYSVNYYNEHKKDEEEK